MAEDVHRGAPHDAGAFLELIHASDPCDHDAGEDCIHLTMLPMLAAALGQIPVVGPATD